MLVGGSAVVIAFLVGVMTGRFVQPERSVAYVVPPPPPVLEVPAVAPAPTSSPVETSPTSSGPATAAQARPKRFAGFNAKMAKDAIDGAAPRLKACRTEGGPAGPASVVVTFAPTGRVSNVSLTTTGYAGTRTGNCIVERLREVRVPEFAGAPVTVKRSVTIR
jgi:hypothetical protein